MPIGNAYLSQWHIAEAAFPEGMVGGYDPNSNMTSSYLSEGVTSFLEDPPDYDTLDVVYTNFSSRVETTVNPSEMMQGFPLAKTHDIGVVSHVYSIEMPVILGLNAQSSNNWKIRLNEVLFWLSWVSFMFSSFDRIGGDTQSTIVERASVDASEGGVTLNLQIRTNWVMPWRLKTSDEVVAGRKAVNYDTFVKFDDKDVGDISGQYSGVGLEDVWGVTRFASQASTSFETVVMAKRTMDAEDNMVPDQLNAKMISVNGTLDCFGYMDDKDWENTAVSLQSSNDFSQGVDDSVTKYEDAINGSMKNGGLQLYVGARDQGVGASGRPLLMLPAGMLIGASEMRASAGLISLSKEFSGIFSDIPQMSAVAPTAKLEAS